MGMLDDDSMAFALRELPLLSTPRALPIQVYGGESSLHHPETAQRLSPGHRLRADPVSRPPRRHRISRSRRLPATVPTINGRQPTQPP